MRSSNSMWHPRPDARANGRPMPALARLLSLLAALTLIAACGSTSAPTGGDTGTTASTEAAASVEASVEASAPAEAAASAETEVSTIGSGSTKIVWWSISTAADERAKFEALANAFVQQNPNVAIEINVLENEAFKAKLATAMQSGSPPDMFQSWGGGVLKQYADAGLVQDLTPALQEGGWGDSFQPGPLSLYTFDGQTYGVPWNAGMVGFWYNTKLFEQAGISEPPATWTEFLDVVKKLKDAGITPIALGGKDKWPGHFYWVYLATRIGGAEAFEAAYTRNGSFTDPAFVEAGQKLKELVDLEPFQNGFLGASYPDHSAQIANGNAAMELMGHWAPATNASNAENPEEYRANLGWFPFPTVEGGKGDPSDALGGGDGYAIGKNAPPETIDFVRFLTSVENQTELAREGMAVPPTVKGAEAGMDDPLLQEVASKLANAQYYQLYYDQYLPPSVGQAVNDATQGLFAGTASPEEVAQTIEDAAAIELQPQ